MGCAEMENENQVYVNMMEDSLKRKKRVLVRLLEQTREQELLLKDEEMDPDRFLAILDEKGKQIDELNRLDEGFDRLFKAVEKEINANRSAYETQIRSMQKLIGEVSELGIQIQALEHQNSGHFKVYLASQRKEIREFHLNNRTASSYFQNMANAGGAGEAYYFDRTK